MVTYRAIDSGYKLLNSRGETIGTMINTGNTVVITVRYGNSVIVEMFEHRMFHGNAWATAHEYVRVNSNYMETGI